MKTNRQDWILFLAGLALAAAPMLSAPAATGAPGSVPKTHNLFMGANVSVDRNGKLYPVIGVSGDALVIEVDGQKTDVPLTGKRIGMKIEDVLMLGKKAVSVADLKTERDYTPANDPRRQFARNAGSASAAGAETNLAVGSYVAAELGVNQANALPANTPGRDGAIAQSIQNLNRAATGLSSAQMRAGSDINSAGFYAMKMQEELDKKLFDAMEVTFSISSDRTLHQPYVITVSRIHEVDAKPGEYRNWIMAKALDPIGRNATKVRIFQGGLPPGYEIEWFHLHLYDHGVEIPTSVSSKRVPLTSDEAFQFVLLEYLGGHKTDTLGATVAMAQMAPELRSRVEHGEFPQAFYIRVGKDGQPGEGFIDAGCTQPVDDAEVAAALRTIRFKPALDKGAPINSVVAVRLSQLPM